MKGRLGQIFGKLKRLKNQGTAGTYDIENTDVWSKGTSSKCMYYQVYNIYDTTSYSGHFNTTAEYYESSPGNGWSTL